MNNQFIKDLKVMSIYVGFSTFMFIFQFFAINNSILNLIAEYSLARGAAVLSYMFSATSFGINYNSQLNFTGLLFQYVLFVLFYQLISFLIINLLTYIFKFKTLRMLIND